MSPTESTTTQPVESGDRTEITSRISPVLIRLAYPLFRYLVLPSYFRRIQVQGQEHLPREGAVILAPTHRSRWDPLLVTYTVGRHVTGRDPRFMVSSNEMQGIQGWFIRRLGGFPVKPHQSDIASLRHGIDLLQQKRMLTIFPEGRIVEEEAAVQPLQLGLAYLGLQAEKAEPGLDIQVVPISIHYQPPVPRWCSQASIAIGPPLAIADYCQEPMKDCAQNLRDDLQQALQDLHQGHLED
jgi:1-acyl-sn-glycerol-3-phosphate acyltransferase